ncbi:MAG: hypothetical protein IKW45_06565 [Clostridia bacterium]|nr:hypothetical protein [Clostridia bacterium]
MEKYERLTDKRLKIGCFYEPKSKEERSELIDLSKQLSYENIYTRLAELEDKIENGTLIELPRIIHPNKAEWYVQYQYQSGVIQYYICFSEADAENILKELKEEV